MITKNPLFNEGVLVKKNKYNLIYRPTSDSIVDVQTITEIMVHRFPLHKQPHHHPQSFLLYNYTT